MGNPFICLTCSRTYTNKMNLDQHVKNKHENTYKYTCLKTQKTGKRCKLQTDSKNIYTTHNVTYHREAPSGDFTCQKCQKTFAGKGLLSKHIKYSICDTIKNLSVHIAGKSTRKRILGQAHIIALSQEKMQIVQLTSQ